MTDRTSSSNYSNVHELVSDLVACALIEGARPTSFSASMETKRVKQLLLDEIEDRSRELRKFKAHGNETEACNHLSWDGVEAWKCSMCGELREKEPTPSKAAADTPQSLATAYVTGFADAAKRDAQKACEGPLRASPMIGNCPEDEV